MYEKFTDFIKDKQSICVIQAENPDGDSLGAALALEEALVGKDVQLYCPVDIPKYMRYFEGWSRVEIEFPYRADGYIIVDTQEIIHRANYGGDYNTLIDAKMLFIDFANIFIKILIHLMKEKEKEDKEKDK